MGLKFGLCRGEVYGKRELSPLVCLQFQALQKVKKGGPSTEEANREEGHNYNTEDINVINRKEQLSSEKCRKGKMKGNAQRGHALA